MLSSNKKRLWIGALIGAMALTACGDDEGGGGGGGGGTATITKDEAIAGACKTDRADPNQTCTGTSEYVTCIETACTDEYKTCLGENYKTGDYAGSPCETWLTCLDTATDKCTCTQDSACLSCLTNTVGACAQTASCTFPMCTMNATAGTSGGGAGTGGGGGGGKTCAELLACCNTLPDASKGTCMQAANTWSSLGAQGDQACAAAYGGFCPNG